MNWGGFGYPATKSFGYSKTAPAYGKAIAPWGKGFVKPGGFGKGFGKPWGFGKGFGKPWGFGKGKGFGFPATKAGGFGSVVPATTVATGPSVI